MSRVPTRLRLTLGVAPADAPFIRYLKTGDQLEIELGVPVAPGVAPLERRDEASLPGGRVAVLRHIGPFEDLWAACERLLGGWQITVRARRIHTGRTM